MADENTYDFSLDFEIGVTGECMGKLQMAELKKKLQKEIEEFLEKNDAVASYGVWQNEVLSNYEKTE